MICKKKSGKILAAALSVALLAGITTAALAAETPDYAKQWAWSTQLYETDTEGKPVSSLGTNDISNIVTIKASEDTPPKIGTPVTFTSTFTSDDSSVRAKEVKWYLNGVLVQESSMNALSPAESAFTATYDGSSLSVYCTWSGAYERLSDNVLSIGIFENQLSDAITIQNSNGSYDAGTTWILDSPNCTFTAPVNGQYRVGYYKDTSPIATTIYANEKRTLNSFNKFDGVEETEPIIISLVRIDVSIEKQPTQATIKAGEEASFSVEASSERMPMTYQWYKAETEDGTGEPIEGATEATLTIPAASAEDNGKWFYCLVSNGLCDRNSSHVQLTVFGAPATDPTVSIYDADGKEVVAGAWVKDKASFNMMAPEITGAGSTVLKYSTDGGDTWKDHVPNGTAVELASTLSLKADVLVSAYNKEAPELSKETKIQIRIDNTKPTATVTGNPTEWTNQPVTLTVVGLDTESGLADEPYSFDGGATWQALGSKTFTENGTVNIAVRDNVGNIRTKTEVISKYDPSLPQLTVTGNPTKWQTSNATLTVTASDGESGLDEKPISWDNGVTWETTMAKIVSENGEFSIKVRDKAGNIASELVTVSYVDTSAPKVEITGNPEEWTNEPATLSIAATDVGAGLASLPYSWDEGKTWTAKATRQVTQNGAYTVLVRDALQNATKTVVNVGYLDTITPENFLITGVPENWTKDDVTLQVYGAEDKLSGLANEAYNWNNTGWTANSTFTAKQNGTVTCQVRDKAGNIRTQTVVIDKIDAAGPLIDNIEGIPTEWQTEPAKITVKAHDMSSGLDALAYSFDDGVTWQASPTVEIKSNQAVGLKVRDSVGNISYHPFLVENVDAEPPTLTVAYLSYGEDMKTVIVGLYGTDAVSSKLEYCFNYSEEYPELNVWGTNNQQACLANTPVIVACRDELGNTATKEITPRMGAVNGGASLPLFNRTVLSCGSYTLGKATATTGYYLDRAGLKHEYQDYSVDGRTIHGLAVEVDAVPLSGGYLKGYATMNGLEFPIYWDDAMKETLTTTGGKGVFVIDATAILNSSKDATLNVYVEEFEDEECLKRLNRDETSTGLMLDMTAPVINISMENTTKQVTITAKDVLSGVAKLQYQVKNDSGTSEWTDYTAPFNISTTSIVYVRAEDRVGNKSETSSESLKAASSFEESVDKSEAFFWRTSMFNCYLYNSGEKNQYNK